MEFSVDFLGSESKITWTFHRNIFASFQDIHIPFFCSQIKKEDAFLQNRISPTRIFRKPQWMVNEYHNDFLRESTLHWLLRLFFKDKSVLR